MYDLLKRLDWDGHPCFKTKLPIEHAIFEDTQIVHETVETGCLFVDNGGQVQRFVWSLRDDVDGEQLSAETKISDLKGNFRPLHDPTLQPWTTRSMDFIMDIQSPEATAIVKMNPWWEKLEFQIRSEQHKIDGFRKYLGDRPFNNKVRLGIWMTCLPTLIIFAYGAHHIHYVRSSPFIFCDVFQLVPQCCFIFGFGVTINIFAFFSTTRYFSANVLKAVLFALQRQVQKDWALIMGVDVVEDPDALWHQVDKARTCDSIPVLWQVVTCDESVRQIALEVHKTFFRNAMRKPMLEATATYKSMF